MTSSRERTRRQANQPTARARLESLSGDVSDVIENDLGGRTEVTIADSDVGFETNRCGTWTLAPEPAGHQRATTATRSVAPSDPGEPSKPFFDYMSSRGVPVTDPACTATAASGLVTCYGRDSSGATAAALGAFDGTAWQFELLAGTPGPASFVDGSHTIGEDILPGRYPGAADDDVPLGATGVGGQRVRGIRVGPGRRRHSRRRCRVPLRRLRHVAAVRASRCRDDLVLRRLWGRRQRHRSRHVPRAQVGRRAGESRVFAFTGRSDDELGSDFLAATGAEAVVEVAPDDRGFVSQGCGMWEPFVPGDTAESTFTDGMYEVGSEIEPGRYVTTTGPQCVWYRLGDFRWEESLGSYWGYDVAVVDIPPER